MSFRVSFTVENSRLGDVLMLLAGKVREVEQSPIVDVPKGSPSGSMEEVFFHHVKNTLKVPKGGTIAAAHIKKWLEDNGRSVHGVKAIVPRLLEARLVKKMGSGKSTTYEVLK